MHVTTMTLNDGSIGLVEPMHNPRLDRRVFRDCGTAWEWAHLHDVETNGVRARWYGWASKDLPKTMTAR